MRRLMLVLAALVSILVVAPPVVAPVAAQAADQRPVFGTDTLQIVIADGARHSFSVEIADDVQKRMFGLMFVEALAPDQGMLFLYPRPQRLRMWMRNTLISLDMLFILADGTIESIAARAIPLDETVIQSQGRVSAVLEIPGGRAEALGIRPGDRIEHPAFARDG